MCGPVAELQTALERLRTTKIWQFKWIILFSPFVGFFALMVGLHWLFEWLSDDRVHILDKLDPRWIVANYVFGLLFVPLGYFFAVVSQSGVVVSDAANALDDILRKEPQVGGSRCGSLGELAGRGI